MPWQMSVLGFECRLPTSVPETLTRIAIVNPLNTHFVLGKPDDQECGFFFK